MNTYYLDFTINILLSVLLHICLSFYLSVFFFPLPF